MADEVARHDRVEDAAFRLEGLDVRRLEAQPRVALPRALDHRRGEVHAEAAVRIRREGGEQIARAAAELEDARAGSDESPAELLDRAVVAGAPRPPPDSLGGQRIEVPGAAPRSLRRLPGDPPRGRRHGSTAIGFEHRFEASP